MDFLSLHLHRSTSSGDALVYHLLGVSFAPTEKKEESYPDNEAQWLTGAGGLLLVAAANETDLLPALEDAVASCTPDAASRLAHISLASCRMLVLTLLF